MARHTKFIQIIREKVRNQEYEFTIPHFFEEMANDSLTFDDIENAIMNGAVNQAFKDDPRGTRYEIVGETVDGRTVAAIC
jgi:lipopolysaccharide biosynthesis regulator YciM